MVKWDKELILIPNQGLKLPTPGPIYKLVLTRDFLKFMERDRKGLECNVLRFVAKLDTTRPINLDRRFIIFYHLSDDTISIYEPPLRNSGTHHNGKIP